MASIGPKKKWGQNFLSDPNIARKIVAAAGEFSGPVFEIGPGQGALTGLLLAAGQPYAGIEIDPALAAQLRERYGHLPNFRLIEADFLGLNLAALAGEYAAPPVVVGNIPYNITSPILFRLFDHADLFDRAVLMMQKEVAERLRAPVGTKAYGLLAINAQLFAEVEYRFTVPPHLFFPAPKVSSAVLRLRFRKGVQDQFADFALFRKILRHCFQHRRKMLRKSLSMLFSTTLLSTLSADLTRRPEQLSIPEWQQLSESIHRQLAKEAAQ